MAIQSLDLFLDAIHQAYVSARSPLCSENLKDYIERGRSRTISGIAEDYFAELLCNELKNENLHFFVDQPLSGAVRIVYPDVTIARDLGDMRCEILYMLDLKMDVGYHRNTIVSNKLHQTYLDKAKELSADLTLLQSVPCFGITSKKASAKKRKTDNSIPRYLFRLHPNASYDEVIVTVKNAGSGSKEEELLGFANDTKNNIWVLSEGDHPNEYGESVKITPLPTVWKNLLDKIKANI